VSIDEFEAEQAKWRDLVGGFILAFGDVETITHRLWRDHCAGKPPVFFKERTTKLLSVLLSAHPRNDDVIGCLQEALQIANKRNTIAHNPMQAQVFQHSKTGKILIENAISSETSDDYIDDLQLIELRAEAEELVTRLYMALGFLTKEPRVG